MSPFLPSWFTSFIGTTSAAVTKKERAMDKEARQLGGLHLNGQREECEQGMQVNWGELQLAKKRIRSEHFSGHFLSSSFLLLHIFLLLATINKLALESRRLLPGSSRVNTNERHGKSVLTRMVVQSIRTFAGNCAQCILNTKRRVGEDYLTRSRYHGSNWKLMRNDNWEGE